MFDAVPVEHLDVSTPIVHECVVTREDNPHWNDSLNSIAARQLSTMSDEELDKDWKLNEFFGTIAVINLPSATKRLEGITKELANVGATSFETFRAVNGRTELESIIWKKFIRKKHGGRFRDDSRKSREQVFNVFKGEAGCYMSHYRIIQKVKDAFETSLEELKEAEGTANAELIENAQNKVRKYSRLLILEDDAGFGFVESDMMTVTKEGVGKHLREALINLPPDWDMLYFVVGVHEPTKKISAQLRKIRSSWCQAAYVVNNSMYSDLVDYLKKIEDPKVRSVLPIDSELGQLHRFYNVYAIYPSVVYHQMGTSDITTKHTPKLWQGQPIMKPGK